MTKTKIDLAKKQGLLYQCIPPDGVVSYNTCIIMSKLKQMTKPCMTKNMTIPRLKAGENTG